MKNKKNLIGFISSITIGLIGIIGTTLTFPFGIITSSIWGSLFIMLTLGSVITSIIFGVYYTKNKKAGLLLNKDFKEVDNIQMQKELEPKRNKVIVYNSKEVKPIEFDIDKKYLDKFQHYISNVNSGDCRIEIYDDNFIKTEYKVQGKNYKRDLIPVLKQVGDILKKDNLIIKTNSKKEEFIK